jgi:hypothetical protein
MGEDASGWSSFANVVITASLLAHAAGNGCLHGREQEMISGQGIRHILTLLGAARHTFPVRPVFTISSSPPRKCRAAQIYLELQPGVSYLHL